MPTIRVSGPPNVGVSTADTRSALDVRTGFAFDGCWFRSGTVVIWFSRRAMDVDPTTYEGALSGLDSVEVAVEGDETWPELADLIAAAVEASPLALTGSVDGSDRAVIAGADVDGDDVEYGFAFADRGYARALGMRYEGRQSGGLNGTILTPISVPDDDLEIAWVRWGSGATASRGRVSIRQGGASSSDAEGSTLLWDAGRLTGVREADGHEYIYPTTRIPCPAAGTRLWVANTDDNGVAGAFGTPDNHFEWIGDGRPFDFESNGGAGSVQYASPTNPATAPADTWPAGAETTFGLWMDCAIGFRARRSHSGRAELVLPFGVHVGVDVPQSTANLNTSHLALRATVPATWPASALRIVQAEVNVDSIGSAPSDWRMALYRYGSYADPNSPSPAALLTSQLLGFAGPGIHVEPIVSPPNIEPGQAIALHFWGFGPTIRYADQAALSTQANPVDDPADFSLGTGDDASEIEWFDADETDMPTGAPGGAIEAAPATFDNDPAFDVIQNGPHVRWTAALRTSLLVEAVADPTMPLTLEDSGPRRAETGGLELTFADPDWMAAFNSNELPLKNG